MPPREKLEDSHSLHNLFITAATKTLFNHTPTPKPTVMIVKHWLRRTRNVFSKPPNDEDQGDGVVCLFCGVHIALLPLFFNKTRCLPPTALDGDASMLAMELITLNPCTSCSVWKTYAELFQESQVLLFIMCTNAYTTIAPQSPLPRPFSRSTLWDMGIGSDWRIACRVPNLKSVFILYLTLQSLSKLSSFSGRVSRTW